MTREEALQRLEAGADITYEELGDIFEAFGFSSFSPSYGTAVYYHKKYEGVGMFPAREWLGHLPPTAVWIVRGMIGLAVAKEQLGHDQ